MLTCEPVSQLTFFLFQVKNSKFGGGSTFLVRSGGLPNHSTWHLSTCENFLVTHQSLLPTLKLLQLDQAAWTGTQPEKFSIYLMMEVMVECLGMNWSREKKLFISRGAFGDGGRWKTAGQSSSQSRQPSLPSASLNRWPSPQIRFECKIVRVQGLCRVLVKRYIAQFFKGRSLGNKLN